MIYRWCNIHISTIHRWYIDDTSMIHWWSIDDLSMSYRWSTDGLPMIEPCFAMNGHPRARMKLILRQCEAPDKIYSSIRFPASIYRFKWSIIAGQGSTIKKLSKMDFLNFFFGFLYRSRGSRGTPGRVSSRFWKWKTMKNADVQKIVFFC